MADLITQKCVPCEVGGAPLTVEEIAQVMPQLEGRWDVRDGTKLVREFKFANFVEAMQFVNRVAELAENEGHHPDLHIHYSTVVIELWTHAVGGLSVNDFIVAAKINKLL